jgi:hypothetical protein
MDLLDNCSGTLQNSTENLLEAVFTLAQDEWPQVATPCREWLSKKATLPDQAPGRGPLREGMPGTPEGTVVGIASRLTASLEEALQRGEREGTLHARRLSTALQVQRTCCWGQRGRTPSEEVARVAG